MRFLRLVALFAIPFLGLTALRSQELPTASVPTASVQMEDVSIQTIESDRAVFIARIAIVPRHSLNVQAFSFSAMRVNGIPVYVAPLPGKFVLKGGEPFKLPDVQVTVYFRDLNSLAPLHDAVDQGRLKISGEIAASIDANLLEKLALHSLHPVIVLPFSKEIPVAIPGGEFGRQAELAALNMAAQLTPAAGKLLGVVFPGADAAWRSDLTANQIHHVLLVHTTYTIVTEQGSFPLSSTQLGFWIGPSTALVPAEAVKPWEFDMDAGARLSSGHARVDKDSISVTIQPVVLVGAPQADAAAASPWSLAGGDFKIEFDGKPPTDRVDYTAGLKSSSILHRASPSNYALIRFGNGVSGNPVQMAAQQNGADHFALFRVVRDQNGAVTGTEIVVLPGLNDGREIKFEQPIDDSAFGSPVFDKDGAIALLQDESHATLLTLIKHLDSKPSK